MPESFVRVAPDSTGKMLRTRERTVGANTVQEQYVITQNEVVPSNRVWLSTLRLPTRPSLGADAVQPIFSVFNGNATGGNNVSVRRLTTEIDQSIAYAGRSPILRLFRQTAASGGGTVLTPVPSHTADPAFSTAVSVRADHQGDNVVATTALTAGTIGAQPMWSQVVPRAHTLAGFQPVTEYTLLPNDGDLMAQSPLILRPGEGFLVQFVNGGVALTSAAGNFVFMVKAVLAESTLP